MNPAQLYDFIKSRDPKEALRLDPIKQIEVIDEATQRVFLVDRATTDMSGRLVLIVKEAA
jgi:hypothetical protein